MQGRRIIFFKSLIDKTALCGADAAVAGVGGPVLRSFCGAAVLWHGADGVRSADHPGVSSGGIRSSTGKFAAAGTWREAIAWREGFTGLERYRGLPRLFFLYSMADVGQ